MLREEEKARGGLGVEGNGWNVRQGGKDSSYCGICIWVTTWRTWGEGQRSHADSWGRAIQLDDMTRRAGIINIELVTVPIQWFTHKHVLNENGSSTQRNKIFSISLIFNHFYLVYQINGASSEWELPVKIIHSKGGKVEKKYDWQHIKKNIIYRLPGE